MSHSNGTLIFQITAEFKNHLKIKYFTLNMLFCLCCIIIQRRKLLDLAKAQAQEVAFLRSEVERLRMKTFPALVQIEF